MKVSVFAPSDGGPRTSVLTRRRATALLLAYLLLQLAFLAPSLEDIDSINFALGLRDFDVAEHQPHPPGYPSYIALGRVSLGVITAVAPGLERMRAEALALAVWSAIGAAVALAAAFHLYRTWGSRGWPQASLLLAATPLFWISALRPMSDMPGLAAALVAQAVLLASLTDRTFVAWGALIAGLAAGIRTQAVWLTVPLILLAIVTHRERIVEIASRAIAAGAAGVLAWLVPLVIASGGVAEYVRALGAQADEDLTIGDILWSDPTPRRLAFSLYETFVVPWGSVPLAMVILLFAAVGGVAALIRERRGVLLMILAFGPYLVFHLLFQGTFHVRYALPMVVPVAWLAARGIAQTGSAAPVVYVVVVMFATVVSATGVRAYTAEPHPAFRAIADMARTAATSPPAAVFSHHALRRPLQAWAPEDVKVVEPPRASEWKDLVDYWRSGGVAPVWFVADTRRTDLALIDPQSRRDVTHYQWRAGMRTELSGARPGSVDWYRFEAPGWFAGEGWSLTPELGGITRLLGTGVDRRPIEAMVRRRPERTFGVVGARHLGTAADGGVVFTLAVDGREVDTWRLDPARGPNVLHVVELPAGALAGEGTYARLTVEAQPMKPGAPTPPVAVRQFDIQPEGGLLHAFDEGWHEEEYENATGLRWRWTSGRSILRIVPAQAIRLRLRGESPLKYYDSPPRVRVTAGGRTIAEFHPDDDFDWNIQVPSADMIRGGGVIAIETEPIYLPAVAEGTSDERRLGLRLFEIQVAQVLP